MDEAACRIEMSDAEEILAGFAMGGQVVAQVMTGERRTGAIERYRARRQQMRQLERQCINARQSLRVHRAFDDLLLTFERVRQDVDQRGIAYRCALRTFLAFAPDDHLDRWTADATLAAGEWETMRERLEASMQNAREAAEQGVSSTLQASQISVWRMYRALLERDAMKRRAISAIWTTRVRSIASGVEVPVLPGAHNRVLSCYGFDERASRLTPEMVRDSMQTARQSVRGCTPGMRGTTQVRVQINGEAGIITDATIMGGTRLNQEQQECVKAAFGEVEFPRFDAPTFGVTFPYRLGE